MWTIFFSMFSTPRLRGWRNLGWLACFIVGVTMLVVLPWRSALVTWAVAAVFSGLVYFAYESFAYLRARDKARAARPNPITVAHALFVWPIAAHREWPRMSGTSRPALAPGIRVFLAWKSIGVLWTLAYVVFAIRWALPRFSQGASEYATEVAIDASEAGLTILGLVLVVQRHRVARWYCIVLLALYCLARLSEVLLRVEPLMPALFLVTGIAWLAYWLFGQAPRALALSGFWTGTAAQSRRNL
jgi:hypothetical protein